MVLGADEAPPPKPSRQPLNSGESVAAPVSTYIVAQSPEVLAQLLKDNQSRGVCPSVYTTPASPFNTLAVQFQDEDQALTTAVAADLPFSSSESPGPFRDGSSLEPASLEDVDSLDSGDTVSPLLSNLGVSDCQSPITGRKHQLKDIQNLYSVSSKLVGSITGDIYSPVQKLVSSNPVPVPPASSSAAACGEIYGPVVNFTQSSAIVGNLGQSPSLAGSFGDAQPASVETQPSSQFASPQSQSQYPRGSGATSAMPIANAECLYGPVIKFRARAAAQSQCVSPKSSTPPHHASQIQNARSNLVYGSSPGQNFQPQSFYPQNYHEQQQVYSNIAQTRPPPIYAARGQSVQNFQRQNSQGQFVAYPQNQQFEQHEQQSAGPNPVYTVHATPTNVVQAQCFSHAYSAQGAPPHGQPTSQTSHSPQSLTNAPNNPCQQQTANSAVSSQQSVNPSSQSAQHAPGKGHGSQIQFSTPSSAPSQHVQIASGVNVIQQQAAQTQLATPAPRPNPPTLATGLAKITTFVPQKPDEQLTRSTDSNLSSSLVSSAVSDSTVSSTSSVTEESQQDQV